MIPSDQLHHLMTALAEHDAALPDDQVLADAAAAGTDVKAEAESVRDVLLGAMWTTRRGTR